MFVRSIVFALALGPDPEIREPPADGELPHWREFPEPSPESEEPPKPPKVPSDGSGMITLGGILLGTGGTLGLMSIGLTIANEPRTRSGRELAAFSTAPTLGAGIVFMTLGLVIRRQFRASEAASIPDAPRTGGGMILGGIGLMLGGTAFAAQALVALSCAGEGCYDTRPIGVPIQLGCALASVAVGAGLLVPGVRRRLGYQRWAVQRAQLQPTISVGATSLAFGLAGRF